MKNSAQKHHVFYLYIIDELNKNQCYA